MDGGGCALDRGAVKGAAEVDGNAGRYGEGGDAVDVGSAKGGGIAIEAAAECKSKGKFFF